MESVQMNDFFLLAGTGRAQYSVQTRITLVEGEDLCVAQTVPADQEWVWVCKALNVGTPPALTDV
jgi:hypothetical protein